MSASFVPSQDLYYRVDHPEFNKNFAYRCIGIVDYGESAWSQLYFINHRGMTYAVKNFRCHCMVGQKAIETIKTTIYRPHGSTGGDPHEFKQEVYFDIPDKSPLFFELKPHWIELPFPKPVGHNPDIVGP
jgi:hypothetical protein